MVRQRQAYRGFAADVSGIWTVSASQNQEPLLFLNTGRLERVVRFDYSCKIADDRNQLFTESPMAIEFNCPYCAAAIRVPDAYSGKKGSCPKCQKKLLVPNIVPPAHTEAANSPELEAPTTNVPASQPTPTNQAGAQAIPAAVPVPVPAVPELPISPVPETGLPVFAAPATNTTSMSKRLKKKTKRSKSQRLYSIGIPVVCFLMFFGVVAIIMNVQQPELKGTLRASRAIRMQIPTASFPLADLGFTGDQQAAVQAAFETETESFVSSQMTCRINSDGTNLVVDVSIGDGFMWFAVNPSNDLTLSDWIRQNKVSLNSSRLQHTIEAGKELCNDKLRKASGETVVFDAERYRDGFGLNAHVKAFGYAVEAIAAPRKSVCVHEDANGTMYFALPEDTKSFKLQGRSFGGAALFPGEYEVQVLGEDTLPAPATEEEIAEPEGDAMEGEVMEGAPIEGDSMEGDSMEGKEMQSEAMGKDASA